MSSKSRRRPQIAPRPKFGNEQLRDQMNKHLGGAQRVFNQRDSIELCAGIAANLERLLNNKKQLPWIVSTIEKRSDGFSLHVQVIEPSTQNDAEVVR